METNFIVAAIPVFFLLIGVELAAGRWLGRPVYRLSDSVNNMATGIIDQIASAVVTVAVPVTLYQLAYDRWHLLDWSEASAWTWVVGFVGADLCYYWWHRMSHEVNLLWATHVVHHQSQEYNLSVALRQTPLANLTNWVFYLPLAFLGVPPVVFLATKSFMILYQFWIHTRLIGSLGPLEWVFNTPSHHRVHHGINPRYIDRNYAGTFIVWDRLFGTFEKESEEPLYGTLKPLASWNPVWAMVHSIAGTAADSLKLARPFDRLKIWMKHPGWTPNAGDSVDLETLFNSVRGSKFDVPLSRRRSRYLLSQFLVVLGASAALLFSQAMLPPLGLAAASLYLVFSLYSLGTVAERRRYAPWLEALRLLPLALGLASYFLFPVYLSRMLGTVVANL